MYVLRTQHLPSIVPVTEGIAMNKTNKYPPFVGLTLWQNITLKATVERQRLY